MSQRAFVEQVMGMPVSIHVRGERTGTPMVEEAVARAYAELRRVDALFSTYRADSEVSRVRRGELALADADPLLGEVADLCEEASRRTRGAFSAWLPDETGTVRFEPTGLVKGWAADRAGAILDELPDHAFMLNAGGDVVAGGEPQPTDGQDRTTWRVGVEDPRDRSRIARVVELERGAVATSGTAARGAHLLDPATGRPVGRDGSTTVFGPQLLWADVWATALFVGPADLLDHFAVVEPAYQSFDL